MTGNLQINQSEVSYRRSPDEPWSEAVVITHQSVGGTTGMEYTLEGLSPSTQYTVQVRVRNALGWSDPASGTGTTLDAREYLYHLCITIGVILDCTWSIL